jgi:hypothetical protein
MRAQSQKLRNSEVCQSKQYIVLMCFYTALPETFLLDNVLNATFASHNPVHCESHIVYLGTSLPCCSK